MNNSALKYRAYKALLEADITDEQRQKLIEANIFQKIADFFGAGKDTLTTDLKKIFSNNKLNRRAATAKKNIEKEIDELKEIAKEAGVSEEAVYDMLNLTLKDKNVSPEEVASPPKADSGGESGSGESSGAKPGTPVDPGKPQQAVPTIAAAAAEASGQPPEKGKEQAEEKKVDVPKATKVLAAAIAKQSKADAGVAEKVIGWLVQNKHLMAESGLRVTANDLLKAAKDSMRRYSNGALVLERWQHLAGVQLLKEEDTSKAEEKKKVAKNKFGDLLDDVLKGVGIKEEEESAMQVVDILIALDDLDSVQVK